MDTYFENQVAVVTGAGGTLCSEIAVALAEKGARVVLVGRTKEKLQVVYDKIEKMGGSAMVYPCDVTDEAEVQKMADEVKETWGVCRFLINGAGGNQIKAMTTNTRFDAAELSQEKPEDMIGFFDVSMDAFESVLKINTMGTVIPSRVFAKQMAEAGEGSIVNFASMNTYTPLTRVAPYAMSKAAIANFTQWFGSYFAPAGIRVNAVAPGFFVNERSKNYLGTVEDGLTPRGQAVIGHTPAGRFGQAKDLLGCVMWLLDDRAANFVTGITVPVDGGFLSCTGV